MADTPEAGVERPLRSPILLVESDVFAGLSAEERPLVVEALQRMIRNFIGGAAVTVALGERVVGSQAMGDDPSREGWGWLRDLLEARRVDNLDLSQAETGRKMGTVGRGRPMTQSGVHEMLSKPTYPPVATLLELAAALETSLDVVVVAPDMQQLVADDSRDS